MQIDNRSKQSVTQNTHDSFSKKQVTFKTQQQESFMNLLNQDDSKGTLETSIESNFKTKNRKQLTQQESFLKKMSSSHIKQKTSYLYNGGSSFNKQYYDIKNSQSDSQMRNKFYVLEPSGDYFFQKKQKTQAQINKEKLKLNQIRIAQTQEIKNLEKSREKRLSEASFTENKNNRSTITISNLINQKSLRLNDTIFSQSDKINTKLKPLEKLTKQDFNPQAIDQELIQTKYSQQLKSAMDLSSSLLNDHYNINYDQLNDRKNFEYGIKGFKKFHLHYKKLDRISQKDEMYQDNQSGITQMMQKQETNGSFPSKFGILNENSQNGVIDLRHQLYGDKQIEALSYLTQQNQNVTKFDLCQNRITQQGADQFFKHLTPSVQILNLNKNRIGKLGSFNIRKILSNLDYKLIELNIEDNQLMDENIIIILTGVQQNKTIKKLNISNNQITDACCNQLSDIIFGIQQLKELYLRWNFITSKGSNSIFNQLQDNKNIVVFDISFNQLSGDINQILDFIKHNNSMIHLDLSYNKFTLTESYLIQEALAQNKTLYGFHYVGNYGYVDQHGFLNLNQNEFIQNNQQHIPIKSISPNKIAKNVNDYDLKNICWICDDWREYQFKIKFDKQIQQPLFIHFQYDGYQSRFMGNSQDNLTFTQNFMVPNQQFLYFYTNNEKIVLDPKIQIHEVQKKKNIINFKIQDKNLNLDIRKFNVKIIQYYNELFYSNSYLLKIQIKPRTLPLEYNSQQDKEVVQWSFNNSMFKNFKQETDELLNKCFEQDYNQSKINKLTKANHHQIELKEVLRQNYKLIKDSYKFYSAQHPLGDTWCIQQHQLSYIMKDIAFQGEKILEIDINMKFQQCLIGIKQGVKGLPEKGLVRHSYMEFLCRLIEQKFIRQGSSANLVKAAQAFFTQYGGPVFKKYDCQKWKFKYYFTEECQIILQTYRKIIQDIFIMTNASKKPQFILLEDTQVLIIYQEIVKQLGLRQNNVDEKDINLFFNQSKMLDIDEISSQKVFQLNFTEFQEFLVRVAQQCSIQPFGYKNEEDRPLQDFSFYYKLEAICQYYIHNFLSLEAKQIYKYPETSVLLQLEMNSQ